MVRVLLRASPLGFPGGGVRGETTRPAREDAGRREKKKKPPTLATVFFVRAAKNGAFLAAQLALANALFFPPVARNSLDARIVADVRKTLGLGFVPTFL